MINTSWGPSLRDDAFDVGDTQMGKLKIPERSLSGKCAKMDSVGLCRKCGGLEGALDFHVCVELATLHSLTDSAINTF